MEPAGTIILNGNEAIDLLSMQPNIITRKLFILMRLYVIICHAGFNLYY